MTGKRKQKIIEIAFLAAIFTLSNAGIAVASQITSEKMVELTNASRKDAGLQSLTVNDKLTRAAQAKAADMFAKQYFDHTSPEGVTPWYWFDYAGYDYIYGAENLALDFSTAEGAHNALMKSTKHRENILGANYKDVGIAVAQGKFEGKNKILIVEEFGFERQHITVNNAPFFESLPAAVPAAAEKLPKSSMKVSEPEETIVAHQDSTSQSQSISSQKIVTEKLRAENNVRAKVMTEAYSTRDARMLKAVYRENIYWKKAENKGVAGAFAEGEARVRALLGMLVGEITLDF